MDVHVSKEQLYRDNLHNTAGAVEWGGAEPASSYNNYFNSVLIREGGFLKT